MIRFDNDLFSILHAEGFPVQAVTDGFGPRSLENLHISVDYDTSFVMIKDRNSEKVTKGRPASMLRRLLYPMVSEVVHDTVFENIANKIKAQAELTKGTIQIWDADRIKDAYHMDNYVPDSEVNTGSLYSCMRYDWAQKFMSWYEAIGEGVVRIAVLTRNTDNLILGRALVWTLPDGRIFMDRVYGSDSTRQMFKDYAREQGWWKRQHDSYDYKSQWINPVTALPEDVTIEIPIPRKKRMLRNIPYVDTFSYMDFSKGVIHNNGRSNTIDAYLEATRGTAEFNYDRLRGTFGLYDFDAPDIEELFLELGKKGGDVGTDTDNTEAARGTVIHSDVDTGVPFPNGTDVQRELEDEFSRQLEAIRRINLDPTRWTWL